MNKKKFSFSYDKAKKEGKLKVGMKVIELSFKKDNVKKGSSSMSYGLNLI